LDINFAEVEFGDTLVFQRMKAFYMATAKVANLEHFYIGPVMGPFTDDKLRIRLVPVGVMRKPGTLDELCTAIKQILSCLFSLHEYRYVHCDIRWNNIIQVFGDWFLIDCEFACHLDELDLLTTRSSATIQKRFVMDESKPWNPLFDLYQVGLLLSESGIALNETLGQLQELLLSRSFSLVSVKRAVSML